MQYVSTAAAGVKRKLWKDAGRGAILPLATLMLVGLMVVPVPSTVLDIGFITNIMISLAVLMVALNAAKPLDFSAFPTVLLFATLLRLSLNVASTRVVLVNGHTGEAAAGHVIESFGNFLIGGNYAVPSMPCPASRWRSTPISTLACSPPTKRNCAARKWRPRLTFTDQWTALPSS